MINSHILMKVIALFTAFAFIASPLVGFNYSVFALSQQQQQQKEEQTKIVAKKVDQKQLNCLATNLYFEAGGEPIEGIAAVARVVMNRIHHGFGSNPCQVIYQANMVQQTNEETDETFWIKVCQFSWVCEGKRDPNKNSLGYQKSLQVAYDVLAYNKYEDVVPKNTLFFHNTSYVNEYPHEVTARIGNHVFYTKKKVKKKRDKQKKHRYFKQSAEKHLYDGELQAGVTDRS